MCVCVCERNKTFIYFLVWFTLFLLPRPVLPVVCECAVVIEKPLLSSGLAPAGHRGTGLHPGSHSVQLRRPNRAKPSQAKPKLPSALDQGDLEAIIHAKWMWGLCEKMCETRGFQTRSAGFKVSLLLCEME